MTLWFVDLPHFCCGIETDPSGRVVVAAPIMKWALGKNLAEVRKWVAKKRGKMEVAS